MLRVRITLQSLMKVLAILFSAFLLAPAAWAQNTGQIRVTVTDENKFEFPGVSITLSSSMGTQKRETDDGGVATFTQLLPGTYAVAATAPGYQTTSVEDITVFTGGRTSDVRIEMVPGEVEVIKVEDNNQPTVDVNNTSMGQVLTQDIISNIPTGRSYQSAAAIVTGVNPSSVGGNIQAAGASYNENTYMLDGAQITDPVTGTFSTNFNYDAIKQVEVVLGGYMPEYGQSLGAVVNLVTETGDNNLKFSAGAFYSNGNWSPRMDARLTADGLPLGPTGFDSQNESLQVNALLSGPVVKDKAWFILSYQWDRYVAALTGIPQPRDYDGHYLLAKLTVQPNSEHRIAVFAQVQPTTIDNGSQSDPYQKASAQDRQAQGGLVANARWQWFISPDVNLDTSALIQTQYLEGSGVPCTHDRSQPQNPCRPGELENNIDWYTAGRLGLSGAFNSQNTTSYDFDDRLRLQFGTKLQVVSLDDPFGGTHDLKFGIQGQQTVHNRLFGIMGNTIAYDLNRASFNPDTFTNYYWMETSGPIRTRATGSQVNAFAQDSWKPLRNLTINYGLRYDGVIARDDRDNAALRSSLFGPRLYAAWDPGADQKTKIAIGYGRFNDSGNLEVAQFGNTAALGTKMWLGEYFSNLNATGYTAGAGGLDERFGYVPTQGLMYDISPRLNTSTVNDQLRLPRSDEFIFQAQRQLIKDVAAGVNGTAKFTRYIYVPDELNLIYDEDGSSVIGSRFNNTLFSYARLRTPDLARRNYYSVDVFLEKVSSKRTYGRVSYQYANNFGSAASAQSGAFMVDQQVQYNYGQFLNLPRHTVKAFGYWDIVGTDPHTTTVSANFFYVSGEPLERLYPTGGGNYGLRIRPRGVYTTYNPYWQLDFGLRQKIDVTRGRMELWLDVMNVLNAQTPQGLSTYYLAQENRLFTFYRQDPTSFLVGLRYDY